MNLNLANLHKRLIAVARANPPSDQVPYAFEKRILARLASLPAVDEWAGWVRALWCSACVCAVIAMSLGVWFSMSSNESELGAGFCRDLEQTIFASTEGDTGW
jgi:hypothetical protein